MISIVTALLSTKLGTRLLNTGTWRTSWTVTLITTLVILALLLSRLLFCFLFVFEFHNCVCFKVEPHGSRFVLIIRIFINLF